MRVVLASLAALVLLAALSGCAETAEDCSDGEAFNPHEERCVDATEPDPEVCHAWVSGGAGDPGVVSCTARSDGKAWLESTVSASHDFRIEVRDGAGATVYAKEVQFGGAMELAGARGEWTLSVDFRDVAGNGRILLWG